MMKQIFAWLPAIMLAVFLTQGCGSGNSDTPSPSPTREKTKPSEQPAETEAPADSSDTPRSPNRSAEQASAQNLEESESSKNGNSATDGAEEHLDEETDNAASLADAEKAGDENGAVDEGLESVLNLRREGQFSEALQAVRKLKTREGFDVDRQKLQELEVELRRLQRDAVGLERAIENLVSPTPSVRSFSRRKLRGSGPAGSILLRKAVRDAAPPIAEEAAQLLVEQNDEKWMDSALARVMSEPSAEIANDLIQLATEENAWKTKERINRIADFVLTVFRSSDKPTLPDGLMQLLLANTPAIRENFWPQAYELAVAKNNQATPLIPLLDQAYEQLCNEDDEQFTKLAGDTEAVSKLKDRVLQIIQSGTDKLPDWVGEKTAFVPLIQGLHGRYYRGPSNDRFKELAKERIDPKIQITSKDDFPQGKENIACRWTGFVAIPEQGKYTFTSASDDGQRVWINEQRIIDDWNTHGVKAVSGSIELDAGIHPIRVEFFQEGGGAAITVSWEGPNFDKTVLSGDAVWTYPIPTDNGE